MVRYVCIQHIILYDWQCEWNCLAPLLKPLPWYNCECATQSYSVPYLDHCWICADMCTAKPRANSLSRREKSLLCDWPKSNEKSAHSRTKHRLLTLKENLFRTYMITELRALQDINIAELNASTEATRRLRDTCYLVYSHNCENLILLAQILKCSIDDC